MGSRTGDLGTGDGKIAANDQETNQKDHFEDFDWSDPRG